MDYSAINQEDHPTGASPWDSPLPRPDGTFASTLAAGPSSSTFAEDRPDSRDSADAPSEQNDSGALTGSHVGDVPPQDRDLDGFDHTAGVNPAQTPGGHDEHQSQEQQQQQQQQRSSLPARYQTGARAAQQNQQWQQQQQQQQQQRQTPSYKLQAKITGLERTGKKDLILRFDVQTNMPRFRTTQFRDIRRTHSEFVKLAEHLISSNPEALVPAVPPPLTAAGAGTDEDEFRIKAAMQRWLNTVCSNKVLMQDNEMILFVESDFGYSPLVHMKQPATGVRRKVLKQFTPPPDDTPELHDARPVVKAFYLGTMDVGQKLSRVVKAKRALALAESDLGVKLGTMHAQETHAGLANAYRKMGRTIQTVGDYRAAQGTAEAFTLEDPLNYHSSDAFIVKETLTNRYILLRELNQAEQSKNSKRAAAERLRLSTSVRRDRVDEAIAALDEATSYHEQISRKAQRVTTSLLQEKRRWFSRTANDLLLSIKEYTLKEIEAERRTLATLEAVRPDIRAIDASGGLSRLGRESHPSLRRSNVASSQGPKGDAWSGAPRSAESLSRSVAGTGFVPSAGDITDVATGRTRALSGASAISTIPGDEDDDRLDARNAASRLSSSTF
ncbi:Vacuolar protein sorting-associated protein 17 [Ascosphaera pollenicola]|nr:Vacuolar protein sorting-associated protein 17 [Ascosphaera pollenicola]